MPSECRCPACGTTLRVPDASLGKTVRCQKCQETFKAESDPDADVGSVRRQPDEAPLRRSGRDEYDERQEDADDRPSRRARPSRREEEHEDDRRDDRRDSRRDSFRRDDLPPVKPSSVQTAGTLLMVGGIVSLVWALGVMVVDVLATLGLCCLYPGYLYAIVSGVMAIVQGSSLMGSNPLAGGNGRAAAIMLIVNLVNADPISATMGILALVMLHSDESVHFFSRRDEYRD
jgi:predicted Zn finger-like uncharacterized protein